MANCLQGLSEEERAQLAVTAPLTARELAAMPTTERYIVSRCHQVVQAATLALDGLRFGEAGELVHDFLWDEFADWYVEASKVRMRSESAEHRHQSRRVLVYVWDTCLRLLHPFMPFVTETLWQLAPHRGESLMVAKWPSVEGDDQLHVDAVALQSFGRIRALTMAVRNARGEAKLDVNKKIGLVIRGPKHVCDSLQKTEMDVVCMLARVDAALLVIEDRDMSRGGDLQASHMHLIVDDELEAFIPRAGLIDVVKETLRLTKQKENIEADIAKLVARSANKGFLDRAPAAVVLDVQNAVKSLKEQHAALESSLANLRN